MDLYGKEYFSSRPEYSASYNNTDFASLIVQIIVAIAFIELICAFIVGYTTGHEKYEDFKWSIALTWWGSGIISAVFIIGFSQIINLLSEINRKLK